MFTVKEILDSNEILVEPYWTWEGKEGNIIIVSSFYIPKNGDPGYEFMKLKLGVLIKNKEIECYQPSLTMLMPKMEENKIRCRVYLDGINIGNYFPEFNGRRSMF